MLSKGTEFHYFQMECSDKSLPEQIKQSSLLKINKLSCPSLYTGTEKLEYTNSTKYLGFTFSSDKKDDNDMLRQLRILYTKFNRILLVWLFNCCPIDVELALFRSYCACFYCPYLWTHYKKSTHSKLRVAFK